MDLAAGHSNPLLIFTKTMQKVSAVHRFLVCFMLDVEIFKTDNVDALSAFLAENHDAIDLKVKLEASDIPRILQHSPPLISLCSFFGSLRCFQLLQSNNANLLLADKKGRLPVHFASAGSLEVCDMLDSAGADFSLLDNNGKGCIHFACEFGNFDMVQRLWARTFDLNQQTNQSTTPLHFACMTDQEEIVEFLLDKGVDVDPKSSDGVTPLMCALKKGHAGVVKILAARVSLDFDEGDHMTPLMWACKRGYVNVVDVLLEHLTHEQIVKADEQLGWTALHCAAENGNKEIVQMLLDKDVPINMKTKVGMTATHLAANRKNADARKILEEHGGLMI